MKSLVEVIKETIPTLVVFVHTDSDVAEVKDLVEEVKVKYEGKAKVMRADDPHGRLKEDFRLEEYPTYILFKEGQELMRESGKKTAGELSEMIDRAL